VKNPRADVWHRQPAEVERQLKAAVSTGNVITLAGGVPADDLFPSAEMDEAMASVMRDDGAAALQYGWPEGHDRLREHIAAWLATEGVVVAPEHILVTSGAQQGLDLLGRLLVPEGAPLAVETPTYTSALQAFDLRKPAWRVVPRTVRGLDLEALADAFGRGGARVLYLVSTGHNPTGGVLSEAERLEVLRLAEAHDAWVIDDDAYGSIHFASGPDTSAGDTSDSDTSASDTLGGDTPARDTSRPSPLRAFGRHLDRVAHLGSFSKVLAPGLRIGFVAGPPALIRELTRLKQAQDLETATLTQRVLARWLDQHPLERHIERCISVYQRRRDVLVDAVHAAFPRARWEAPAGGFSLLLHLPDQLDARALLPDVMRAGMAYEPADPYFVHGGEPSAVRLSFSNVDEYGLRAAVHRLAGVVAATRLG
jgi:2-aminoadipate transaminase